MKFIIGGVFFCLFSLHLTAQQKNFSITGVITSENDDQPLEAATVHIETLKDSMVVTYTITDRQGNFELKGRTYDSNLTLYVSYVGYETYQQQITLENKIIDAGKIILRPADNELDEVLIRSRAPITIKKDTLEFNVSSFNVKKDATVEDLLKELPGVEVDSDGSITVNGKSVNKLLVNGKPFFGDDPTIATRNLSKEMIEKVQVVDTKTDAQAFTGEEGDKENKTINLTISEEKNKGVFGRLAAGGGTDNRFEYAGLFNRFDNDMRISVLGGGNNINSPGFSFGEIQKMFGGGRSVMMNSSGGFRIDNMSFGLGDGLVNSRNAGASYADAYGKNTDISVNYFYSGSNSHNEERIERENIYPDNRFITNTIGKAKGETDSHMVNLKFDVKADTTFLINIKPSFNYAKSVLAQNKAETTFNQNGNTTNSSDYSNFSESSAKTLKNTIDLTKKFGSRGASLRLTLTNEWDESDAENYLNSETFFFDGITDDEIRNQYTVKDESGNKINSTIRYNFPIIANEFFWNAGYRYNKETKTSIKNTYEFNEVTQEFDLFNQLLSSDFKLVDTRYKPWTGLTLRKKDWSFSVDAGYVIIDLSGKDQLRSLLDTEKTYEGIEYSSYINYRFQNNASLYFSGSFTYESPSVNQLQPYEDVSNPLHTVTGNPNLKPIKKHGGYLGYNKFNFQAGTGYNFYANFSYSNDDVAAKTTIDENFVRHTTYTNVDGNYWVYVGANYSKSIKIDSLQTIKLSLGFYGNNNKRVNFYNEDEFSAVGNSLHPDIGFTYTWKDLFEIKPRYSLGYTQNRFDIDTIDDQEFFNHNLSVQTATFIPKNLEWRNDINFIYNPGVADQFDKNAVFWNSSLAYSILNNQGTITFKVYDLLKQNVNTRRSANQNYIQDSQSTVLQQYFMLSFSWKFNNLGSKGEIGRGSIFRF